jgi:hypothetical protein
MNAEAWERAKSPEPLFGAPMPRDGTRFLIDAVRRGARGTSHRDRELVQAHTAALRSPWI